MGWDKFSYVQLKVAFVTDKSRQGGSSREPIALPRTYMTFYDFDTGAPRVDEAAPAPEALQMDPDIGDSMLLPSSTELNVLASWSDAVTETQLGSFFSAAARTELDAWTSPIIEATQYGIGKDNPTDSQQLTPLQTRRSVMFMFENVTTFRLRYAITV